MEFSILNLLFVLLSAWVAGTIVSRMGYPSIFGELTAGIILGPPLLGLLHGSEALAVLAEVGVILMMLYIGMEIDPQELFEASWAGFLAAIGGFITPFVLAYLVVIWFGGTTVAGLFAGIAAGVTSLATKSRILVDLKLLDTRVAHVLMAGALVADTLSLIVFAAIIGVVDAGGLDMLELTIVGVKATLFFVVTMFIGIKLFPPLWKRLERVGLTGRTFNATLILLIALLFAEFAELAGLHAILGAFLAGLFLREGVVLERRLSHELNDLVHDISIGFLAPIFFVTAGFDVSLGVFQTDLALLLAIIFVATAGKIVGTALFYLPSGYGWREGVTVGAGMNGRGAVEIIIAQIGLQMGIISQELFSILVFMAISTTLAVPLMLTWGIDWLRSRGELVRSEDERDGTVIVGAGPTARTMAAELMSSGPVWLVDNNREHCRRAKEEGLTAVCGDALDENVLSEANTARARSFIAFTPNREANVLAAQLARTVFLVPEVFVVTRGDQTGSLDDMLDNIDVKTLLGEGVDIMDWDRWIAQNRTDRLSLNISESMPPQRLVDSLRDGNMALPLVVKRNGHRMPFMLADTLEPGDSVLALSRT